MKFLSTMFAFLVIFSTASTTQAVERASVSLEQVVGEFSDGTNSVKISESGDYLEIVVTGRVDSKYLVEIGNSTYPFSTGDQTNMVVLGVGLSDSRIYALRFVFSDRFSKLTLVTGLASSARIKDVSLDENVLIDHIVVDPDISVSFGPLTRK